MKISIKRIISLICTLAILLASVSVFTASAADFNSTPTFNADYKVTFTVRATGNGSIKFTCKGDKESGHRCNAPELKLTIYPAVNGKNVYYIKDGLDLTPSSVSSTLKGLKKGVTYTITVQYHVSDKNICNKKDNYGASVHNYITRPPHGRGQDLYKNGSWSCQPKNCTISNIRFK